MHFPKDSEVVCVYGWDEALYQEALHWAEGDLRVVFVCHEKKCSTNPRVAIYVLHSPLQIEPFAKEIAWSFVMRKMAFIPLEECTLFQEALKRHHLAAGLLLSEVADWGVTALRNARANQVEHRLGMDLKGAFSGIPALIIGAGPSLRGQSPLIKEFERRALIFASSSALDALDVEPHFAGAIDSTAPPWKRRLDSQTPFCYQSRMNPNNLAFVDGPKLLFPDSSSSAINWLQGEEVLFDGGWTVGNFLTAVAQHMGCDPIVFVGMDFCYVQQKKYANGDPQEMAHLVQNGPFLTQRDWIMAADWMQQLPGRLIDTSFDGMLALPKRDLLSVLRECTVEWDLRQKVQTTIARLPKLQSETRWPEWEESLQRCQHHADDLEQEPAYQHLLLPLWTVWRPVFAREVAVDPKQTLSMHQRVFFQQVLQEHLQDASNALDCQMLEEKKEWFYADGTLKTVEFYLAGKRHGAATLYWPNGLKKRECHFDKGVRHGWDRMWNQMGHLVDEGSYEQGEPVGVHRRFGSKGNLIEEIDYLTPQRFNIRQWDDVGTLRLDIKGI